MSQQAAVPGAEATVNADRIVTFQISAPLAKEVRAQVDSMPPSAAKPLTRDEPWVQFAPGELKVFVHGAPG